jgi:hypothetical protein
LPSREFKRDHVCAISSGEADLLNVLQRDRAPLLAWLTERRDIHERKEDRLETVEWAILIFVIVGVLADIIIVAHELR